MAIYHFSVKNISRGDGRSAVAAAAYRSGEKLLDERQGKEQDYTKKQGVEFSKIYTPDCFYADFTKDRQSLWNTVEQTEKRKDASLAREFEIAFPHELNRPQRQRMLDQLCNEIAERHGVIVDAAIHAPHTDSGSDERNYHAHILFTSRDVDFKTQHFAAKKNRDFNKENSKETVKYWRERFAQIVNHHLERAGHDARVDHQSYQEQGSDLEATQHEGSTVTQLRRMGIATEISTSNDAIKQRNAEKLQLPQLIEGLDNEIIATERLISKLQFEHMRENASKTRIEPSKNDAGRVVPDTQLEAPQRESDEHTEAKRSEIKGKRVAIAAFNAKIEALAKIVFEKDRKVKQDELNELLNEINKLKENIPMLFGRKQHQAHIDEKIKSYEQLQGEFREFLNRGVQQIHREKAHNYMKSEYPSDYSKMQSFIAEIKQCDLGDQAQLLEQQKQKQECQKLDKPRNREQSKGR